MQIRTGTNMPDELETIHDRHIDIADNSVDLMQVQLVERRLSVWRDDDLMVRFAFEHVNEKLTDNGVIVDDEYSSHFSSPPSV